MPFFFVLSGFSLAVTYGRNNYDSCCVPWKQPTDTNIFNSGQFYRNRFARICPIYYFANITMFSLFYSNPSTFPQPDDNNIWLFWSRVFSTLTMTNFWLYASVRRAFSKTQSLEIYARHLYS